jgi:two-component system, OmpR family, response regulator
MLPPVEILHIEDDPEIRIIVDISLRLDPDFSVISVESSGEALSLVEQGPTPPSAILLDYHIGGVTGADLLHRLRATRNGATIPAIFLTARVHAHDVEQMMSAGAVGVLTKPFNPLTLASDIRTLLRGSSPTV